MGYDMRIQGELTLPKEKRAEALAAILAAHDSDEFWSNPDFEVKRQSGEELTFEEVFGEVVAKDGFGGRNIYENEDGNSFSFDGEVRAGWGENQVMNAIAPFVTEGVVTWEGEDGELGRYYFAHGQVEEQNGAVIYGLSWELQNKLQSGVDRDVETMLEQSVEVGADA